MKKCLSLIALFPVLSLAMVADHSFETGQGWQPTAAKKQFTPDGRTQAFGGSHVALFGNWSSGRGQYIDQVTKQPIEPGATYSLSAHFAPRNEGQSQFGGCWLRIIANRGNERFAVAMYKSTEALSGWTKKTLRWTAPADLSSVPELHGTTGEPTGRTVDVDGAVLEILVGKAYGCGRGNLFQTYADDVELTVSPTGDPVNVTLPPSAGTHFKIENGGFEKGSGWNQRKAHQCFTPDGTTKAHSGNAVALTGSWLKGAGEFVYQKTEIGLQANDSYELRAWFAPRKEGQSRYGGAWMRLSAVKPDGSHCVVAHFFSDTPISEWTQYALKWKAPADLSRVRALHTTKNAPTGQTIDIRGAKLEILVGKQPGRGNSYDQTMIDDVELLTTAVVPMSTKPKIGNAQKIDLTAGPEECLDDLDVVWSTPGRFAMDSMPLGNGNTALNVWTEADGQIAFYIARSDAWSGIGRLLKVGRMRLRIEPNPFRDLSAFSQRLNLKSGTIYITGADGFNARIWADANNPVVRFEALSDEPFKLTALNDPWRLKNRTLTDEEMHSAWNVMKGPEKYRVAEADTILPAAGNRIGWAHRNGISVYPAVMELQGLGDYMDSYPDPLINRTFGALAWGAGLKAADDRTLTTPDPVRQVALNLTTFTAQTDTLNEWVQTATDQMKLMQSVSAKESYAAHKTWWTDFWNRSWIYASGPKPDFLVGEALPKTPRAQIKIGGDWPGGNLFSGKIRQALFYNKTLSEAEILKSATTEELLGPKHNWDFGGRTGNKIPDNGFQDTDLDVLGEIETADGAVRLTGKGHFLTERVNILGGVGDLRFGGTLAAWIAPDAMPAGGRIFDFTLPGTDGGYLFEVTSGGTGLRGRYNECTAETGNVLTPGEWAHVAMVYDQFHGELKLFVNGRKVAENNVMDLHRKTDIAKGIYPITQGYTLQRFISACAGRGEFPIKFNGSLFTADGKADYLWTPMTFDADYRKWGPDYWFQNTRLPYWPMIAAGDFDMMEPLWEMYADTLERSKLRTKTYFGHDGAYWSETINFWGMNSNYDYGWDRRGHPPGITVNGPIRRYWDGALELSTMMLDQYDVTQDTTFMKEKILPIAGAVITFYDQHYDRGEDGKVLFQPAQAVESYVGADLYNPSTIISGMRSVLARLLKVPSKLTTPEQRKQWTRVLSEMPEIPVADGMIQVAANQHRHFERGNGECPDLYPAFPYHLYGVGRPNLDVARKTYETLQTWYVGGWNQDAVNAAVLGLTDKAGPLIYRSFIMGSKDAAFPAFWGPNYDWVPDQDHGCTAMNALQRMLIQSVEDEIHLLPAWPKEWDVNFKLHAAQNTTVEMVVRDGKLEKLDVKPASRKKDCILPDWLGGERESYKGEVLKAPVNMLDADEYANKKALIYDAKPVAPLTTYISADELPELRVRLNKGRAGELMEMLRKTADRFLEIETEPYNTDGPYIGRNLQSHVGVLGLVGMIDEDPKYLAKGKEILMALVNQNELSDYVKANTHLSVGDAAAAVALGYDWIGSELSETERQLVHDELREMAEYLYNSSVNPHPHPYQKAHNHSVVAHSGLLLAGHILGRRDWVDYSTPWVRGFLQEFQDGSGAPYEGVGYSEYGMMMGIMSAEVLRRHYKTDLLDEVTGLEKMPGFLLHHTEPWGGGIIPQNQTGRSVAGATGYYYIINRLEDSAGLHAWESLLGPEGIAELGKMGHDSHFRMFPFLALWTDNDLEPVDPLETGEPVFKTYDRGMVSARTAWGDPEAGLVTFQSARQTIGIWDHPDENSYTFTALGDNLIIDPGPHIWENDSHNMILIDGTGFRYFGPGHRTQGTLEEAEDRGDCVYMVGDAADAYRLDAHEKETGLPVKRAERRLLFVRGKEPFLVVVDKLEMKDDQKHDFTLRTVYADSDDKNKAFFQGTKAHIIGGRNGSTATMHFLQPDAPTFKNVKLEGQHEFSAEAFDVTITGQETADFVTVITCAPKGANPATVEYDQNRIELTLSNGEEWVVKISQSNIKARRD